MKKNRNFTDCHGNANILRTAAAIKKERFLIIFTLNYLSNKKIFRSLAIEVSELFKIFFIAQVFPDNFAHSFSFIFLGIFLCIFTQKFAKICKSRQHKYLENSGNYEPNNCKIIVANHISR